MKSMQQKECIQFLLVGDNKDDLRQEKKHAREKVLIIIHDIFRKCAECNNLNLCHFFFFFLTRMSFRGCVCEFG